MKFLLCFLLSVSGALAASNVSVVYNSTNNTVVQSNLIQNFSSVAIQGTNVAIALSGKMDATNGVGYGTLTVLTNLQAAYISDTNGVVAQDLINEYLFDGSAGVSVDYGQRRLMDDSANLVFDWQSYLIYDHTAKRAIDINSRAMLGASGIGDTSIDWGNRFLVASDGNESIDWEGRQAFDAGNAISMDYTVRKLYNNLGAVTLDFQSPSGIGITNINGQTFIALGNGTNITFTTNNGKITINSSASGGAGATNWLAKYPTNHNSTSSIDSTNDVYWANGNVGNVLPAITNVTGRVITIVGNYNPTLIYPHGYPGSSDATIDGSTNFYTLNTGTVTLLAEAGSTGTNVAVTNANWTIISPKTGVTLTTSGGTPDFAITGSGGTALTINVANANGTGQLVKDHTPGVFYPTLFFDGGSGILFKSQVDGLTKMQLLYPSSGQWANFIQFFNTGSPFDFFQTLFNEIGADGKNHVDIGNPAGDQVFNFNSRIRTATFTNLISLNAFTNQLAVRNYASNAPASILESRWPVSKTANYFITALESGTTFNNQGSTSNIVFTLPATVTGQHFKFTQNTSDQIAINAPSGSSIRAAGLTNNSFSLSHIGTSVDIEAVNATNWFVLGQPGLIINTNNQTAGVEQRLNFLDSASVTVSATDNPSGAGSVDVSFNAIGGGSVPVGTVVNSGTPVSGALFKNSGTTGTNAIPAITTEDGSGNILFGGNLRQLAGATLSIASGTNARAGILTLSGGTATLSNTTVTANTIVLLTHIGTAGATMGELSYVITPGVNMVVTSTTGAADSNLFAYLMIETP